MSRQIERVLSKINKLKPKDKRQLWAMLTMAIPQDEMATVEQTAPKQINWLLQRVPGGLVAIGIDGIQPVCYFKACDDNRDAIREIREALAEAKPAT